MVSGTLCLRVDWVGVLFVSPVCGLDYETDEPQGFLPPQIKPVVEMYELGLCAFLWQKKYEIQVLRPRYLTELIYLEHAYCLEQIIKSHINPIISKIATIEYPLVGK